MEKEDSMPKRARCPHCDRLFNRDVLDSHIQKCRSRGKRNHNEKGARRQDVIVDGNNVAYHLAPTGKPRVANLVLARQSLVSAGYKPIIVVSAALVHKIDKPDALRELIGFGHIMEATKGKNDDLIIIQTAQRSNADIVSNDRFLDWQGRYPWISGRLRRYRMTPSGLILV
ncbi:MAG: NYN domain-containing protein [Candidatus Thorarchaeota archaeon]